MANGDFMVQIRKMNDLESQHVTGAMSNNYTDSDSVRKQTNKMPYLSDNINEVRVSTFSHNQDDADKFKINYSNIQVGNGTDNNVSTKINEHHQISELDTNTTMGDESSSSDSDSVSINVEPDCVVLEKYSSDNKQNIPAPIENNITPTIIEEKHENHVEHAEPEHVEPEHAEPEHAEHDEHDEQTKNIDQEQLHNDKSNDNSSCDTSNLEITILKPVNTYKKSYLDKLAKKLMIPTTCKDENGRHSLKKEELYDKISEVFSKITK